MPLMTMIVVKAAFDPEVRVWYIEHSDIPGLNLEAPTIEALMEIIPGAVLDLLETNDGGDGDVDVPIEIIAHASTRARSAIAA